MKVLLKILLAGVFAFMAVAIVQEWDFFSSSWFGEPEPAIEFAPADEAAAEEAVRLTLSLMRHLYASGGDERFAERIPASDAVIAEMKADIEYLERNQRRQDPQLSRLEVLELLPLAEDRAELQTREVWQTRTFWRSGETQAEPVSVQVLFGRYLVARGPRGWMVVAWAFVERAPSEEGTDS